MGVAVAWVMAAPADARPQQSAPAADEHVVVLSPEENRLNAYDGETFEKQLVRPSAADDPEHGLDLNGQVCFDPDRPRHFIAGEDTGQPRPPASWGYFRLDGDRVGDLAIEQLGNLTPTYLGPPENVGCGFLPDGRLVTTSLGNQLPLEPVNGELIVWFPPFDRDDVPYCKIDLSIATAGHIAIGPDGSVYVASNRPGDLDQLELGGVFHYTGDLPTSNDAAGGCGRRDPTGAPLVDEGRVTKQAFLLPDVHVVTASAPAFSPRGTMYVSSVFTGVVSEYSADGTYIRDVVAPPLGLPTGQLTGITPFGLAVAPDGSLFVADLGIVGPGPADGEGSVVVVRFDAAGNPRPPEVVDDRLTFPDGLGLTVLTAAAAPAAVPDDGRSGTQSARDALPATGGTTPLLALATALLAALLGRRSLRRAA